MNDKDDAGVKAALANGAVAATTLSTGFTDGALLLFKDIGSATACTDATSWSHVMMMGAANTAYGINSLGLASGMGAPDSMSLDAATGAEKIDLSKFTPVTGSNGLYQSAAGKKVCIFMNNCAFVANNNARFKAFRSGKKISA